jgi:hypothetical protein
VTRWGERVPTGIGIAAATVLAMVGACWAGQTASARVVQTIKLAPTGHEPRYPTRIALGPSGLLYVLDMGDRSVSPVRMSVYSLAGRLLRRWHVATESSPIPNMVVDSAGNAYVAAARSVDPAALEYSILSYSPTGQLLSARWADRVWDSRRGSPVLASDGQGHVLVAFDGRIETFDAAGRPLASWQYLAPGNPNNWISGLSVGTSGIVYVADRTGVAALDASGNVASRIVPAGNRLGLVSWASLVPGPADDLYAVQGQRIQRFGADGQFLGAVGSDRHVQWLSAAVADDGSIYVPQNRYGGVSGIVVKLAPITNVDVTPPSITVDYFSDPPNTRNPTDVLGRLTYRLSEDASFRISLQRRSSRKGHRNYGRYLHLLTLDKDVTSPGIHRLVLRLPRQRRFSAGRYELTLVARDDAGSESKPARVRFSIARS